MFPFLRNKKALMKTLLGLKGIQRGVSMFPITKLSCGGAERKLEFCPSSSGEENGNQEIDPLLACAGLRQREFLLEPVEKSHCCAFCISSVWSHSQFLIFTSR